MRGINTKTKRDRASDDIMPWWPWCKRQTNGTRHAQRKM